MYPTESLTERVRVFRLGKAEHDQVNVSPAYGIGQRRCRQSICEAAHDFAVLETAHFLGRQCDVVRPFAPQVGGGYLAFAPCHRHSCGADPQRRITADSAAALIAARALQGFATGLATATLGAVILDNDRSRGPILNSITAFGGLTVGSLGAAILVTYAPDPRQLVYVVLLVLSAVEAFILWSMPETAQLRVGALASLRPRISVPARARDVLVRVTPMTVASWALGGFYFSLMPALVRVATGVSLPVIGGLVVSALTFSGAISVLLLRSAAPGRIMSGGIVALAVGVAITLAGVREQLVWLMLVGTVISGIGFGAAFSGTMRTVLPLAKTDERAGLLAAFYVEGYLSFSLPAVLAGLAVPMVGLPVAAYVYGTVVIVMALASMIAVGFSRH